MQNERGSPMSLMLMSISFALYCGLWLALNGRMRLGHVRSGVFAPICLPRPCQVIR